MSNNGVTTSIETIKPAQASALLGLMGRNRGLRSKRVVKLAEEIINGRWRMTGESVVIASDGALIDGQHRLQACVMSNTPIKSVVVRGVDPIVLHTLDTGVSRSAADVLSIHGYKHAASLASILRGWYNWVNGTLINSGSAASNQDILNLARRYPVATGCAEWLNNRTPKHVQARNVGVVRFITMERSDLVTTDIKDFFDRVCDGANVDARHPARVLRERLLKNAYGEDPMRFRDQMRAVVYAWNAFYEGRTLQRLIIKGTPTLLGVTPVKSSRKTIETAACV